MNLITARYGEMPIVGEFTAGTNGLKRGDTVVLKTDRGTEIGTILAVKQPAEDAEKQRSTDGGILREATSADKQKYRELLIEAAPREHFFCVKKIAELKLPMKLVQVEHLLGGEKIIFYFLADGRVDFRQLVKDLVREYHTRIEMKQIGVRDEAKLKGDIEHCGQELCCRKYMKNFEPVTMKMAKSQKATLDPSKISGHCGRLMCCLRYEDNVYNEFRRKLPRRGSRVLTKSGAGVVINYDILAQKVIIETDARVRLTVGVDEVIGRDEKKPEDKPRERRSERKNRNEQAGRHRNRKS